MALGNQQSGMAWLGSLLGVYKADVRCRLGWTVSWRFWGKIYFQDHSSHGQNSVLCGCRTEVLESLLAVIQGLLCASKGCLHSLTHGPSTLKPGNPLLLLISDFCPLSIYIFYFLYTKLKGDCGYAENYKNSKVQSASLEIVCSSDCPIYSINV